MSWRRTMTPPHRNLEGFKTDPCLGLLRIMDVVEQGQIITDPGVKSFVVPD